MNSFKSKVSVLGAIGFAALMAVSPASAQPGTMRVNIPFSFVAGEQILPAGPYLVNRESGFNLLQIRSLQETQVHRVFLKTGYVSRKGTDLSSGVMTFQQYGNTYVLRGVWAPTAREGHELKVSKAETELARTNGGAAGEVAVGSVDR